MKKAFTLAEVLITLGIIGIVAALTIPTLMSNYKKNVVETRLKKVYTTMNQAILLSEAENGDRTTWDKMPLYGNSDMNLSLNWMKKYILPYIKYVKIEPDPNGETTFFIWFPDGSKMAVAPHVFDMAFYPEGKTNPDKSRVGVDFFSMHFLHPVCINEGIMGYPCANKDDIDWLMNVVPDGCKHDGNTCTRLIQLNGWKIPDDYPKKF